MLFISIIEKDILLADRIIHAIRAIDRNIRIQVFQNVNDNIASQVMMVHVQSKADIEQTKDHLRTHGYEKVIFYSENSKWIPYAYEVRHEYFIKLDQMKDRLPKAINALKRTECIDLEEIIEIIKLPDRIRILTKNKTEEVIMQEEDFLETIRQNHFIKVNETTYRKKAR